MLTVESRPVVLNEFESVVSAGLALCDVFALLPGCQAARLPSGVCRGPRSNGLCTILLSLGAAISPAQPSDEPGTILSANAYMLMYRRRGWHYSGSLASKSCSLPDRHASLLVLPGRLQTDALVPLAGQSAMSVGRSACNLRQDNSSWAFTTWLLLLRSLQAEMLQARQMYEEASTRHQVQIPGTPSASVFQDHAYTLLTTTS